MSCARGMKKGKKLENAVPLCQPIEDAIVIPVNYVEFNFSGARGGVISLRKAERFMIILMNI